MIKVSNDMIYDTATGIHYRRLFLPPAGLTAKEAEAAGRQFTQVVDANSVHSNNEYNALRVEGSEAVTFWESLLAHAVPGHVLTQPTTPPQPTAPGLREAAEKVCFEYEFSMMPPIDALISIDLENAIKELRTALAQQPQPAPAQAVTFVQFTDTLYRCESDGDHSGTYVPAARAAELEAALSYAISELHGANIHTAKSADSCIHVKCNEAARLLKGGK